MPPPDASAKPRLKSRWIRWCLGTGLYPYWLALMWPIIRRRRQRTLAQRRAFYEQWVKPGNLCFDVGANTGSRTEVFLALGARVVAVEPQPSCVRFLELRFRGALRQQRLWLLACGLDRDPGVRSLRTGVSSLRLDTSTFSPDWIREVADRDGGWQWGDSVEVPCLTLEHVIARFGVPDYCKIDVEGFEAHVLGGLRRSMPLLSFEYNLKYLDPALAAVERLSALADYAFNFTPGETLALALDDWVGAEALAGELRRSSLLPVCHGDVFARRVR